MTRLNSRQRKRLYKYLVDKDGEKCKKCSRTPKIHGTKLVIDRINNNDTSYHPTKIQLLCYKCNYLKNPRKRARTTRQECVSESVKLDAKEKEELAIPTEIEINRAKEPKCLEYAEQRLAKEPDGVPMKDLIDSAAFKADCSPITAERYLRKQWSSAGPYELISSGRIKLVRKKLKPHKQ